MGMARKKNVAAVALGKLRRKRGMPLDEVGSLGGKARAKNLSEAARKAIASTGGKVGGAARAKALTKAERSEIAKKAAAARWGKTTRVVKIAN